MGYLTRQQLCAALSISESTVRKLELLGLPFTPVGKRAKRYDLDEVKAWLRANQARIAPAAQTGHTQKPMPTGSAFTEAYSKVKFRVMPS